MNRVFAVFGFVFAGLLTPPVHEPLFALEPLHTSDALALWLVSLGIALFGALLWRTKRAWLAKLSLLVFALLAAELGSRVVIAHFTYWPREKLAALGRATYPDLLAYQPHPFLQFTGRPDRILRGNAALSSTTPFNREGFPGRSVPRPKPTGTRRVVCLGGSTTASGYPELLAEWFAEHAADQRFECINLAHGFYDSTHSVVNFTLNAIDYEPDYVVVHHGWNDGRAARNAASYRGDHSHVLKAFAPPTFADWLPIRASVVYRFLRFRLTGNAGWSYLDAALLQPVHNHQDVDLQPALTTFERNLRTIVDLALLRGITPVLATLPHSTAADVPFAQNRPDLPKFAAVIRKLAAEYGDRVVFVDLDAELTGQNELYQDLAHMHVPGRTRKAAMIGKALLAHIAR